MIYSSWNIEQNILKLVILAHFLPFCPLKNPKIRILKNERICWRYHHFTHVCEKSQSYDALFLRYGVRQTECFVIVDHFLPLHSPMDPENQNFEKNEKNTWRYYHFTNVYHKWQSYDIWFFRYGVQQTKFWQFGPFFALLPFWKNEKKAWRYHYFSYVYQKLWPDGVRFLRYAVRRTDGRTEKVT